MKVTRREGKQPGRQPGVKGGKVKARKQILEVKVKGNTEGKGSEKKQREGNGGTGRVPSSPARPANVSVKGSAGEGGGSDEAAEALLGEPGEPGKARDAQGKQRGRPRTGGRVITGGKRRGKDGDRKLDTGAGSSKSPTHTSSNQQINIKIAAFSQSLNISTGKKIQKRPTQDKAAYKGRKNKKDSSTTNLSKTLSNIPDRPVPVNHGEDIEIVKKKYSKLLLKDNKSSEEKNTKLDKHKKFKTRKDQNIKTVTNVEEKKPNNKKEMENITPPVRENIKQKKKLDKRALAKRKLSKMLKLGFLSPPPRR